MPKIIPCCILFFFFFFFFWEKSCFPNGCKTCQVRPREEEIKHDDSPNNGDNKEAEGSDAGDVPELLRVDDSNLGE